ncbi:MAG: flippase [bacterium]
MLKRSFRNALLLLSGEGVTRLLGFVTTAILARRLGVDAFGQIGFATAVLAYGVSLSDFGLVTTGSRRTAESSNDPTTLARRVLGARAVTGMIAACLVVTVALLVPKPPQVRLLVAAYAVVTLIQAFSLEWLFFGLERTGRVALSRSLTSAIYFGLCLALVRGSADVLMVPAAFAVATATGVLFLAVLAAARFSARALRPSLSGLRDTFKSSWPVGLAGFLIQAHVSCGVVFLGLLRSDAETGLFTGASKLALVFLTLDRVLYTIFLPVIARTLASARERVREVVSDAARIALAIGSPLLVGTATLAPWLIKVVLGTEYADAAATLRLLGVFLPLTLVNSVFSYTVIASGRERLFLRNVAISAALSVVGSAALTATIGPLGAAAALILGEALMLLLMARDCRRIAGLHFDLRIASPILAGACMLAAMLLFGRSAPVAALAAGLAVYVVTLFATKGVTLEEIVHGGTNA